MEQKSFVVGIRYKEGSPQRDSEVASLMEEHNFLADLFHPNHFRGNSSLTPSDLVMSLEGSLAERKIEAFVAVEVLRPPQPFADQPRLS